MRARAFLYLITTISTRAHLDLTQVVNNQPSGPYLITNLRLRIYLITKMEVGSSRAPSIDLALILAHNYNETCLLVLV